MTCKTQPEALRLAARLEDTEGARLPTWQDMLGDAEQFVRQKPTFSKYIRGTVLENDVPVWIADFAQRLLLRELTRLALRAALAEQPAEQEPVGEVAEVAQGYDEGWTAIIETGLRKLQKGDKVYTAPQPAKQPLTREEIFELAEPFGEFQYGDAQGHKRIDFARAIIAAYEQKNGIGGQS